MDIEALPALHWERKAEKARAKAKTMYSADARRLMYDVARRYRQMAGIAGKRHAEKAPPVAPQARSFRAGDLRGPLTYGKH